MAIISQDELNNLRLKANIVDVIGSYIPLEHKGKNYLGVCPFHEDHSPSMSVSDEKQIYKCFSCGAAGNVFTFIQNYENVSFVEAVNIIARRYGVTLSEQINVKKKNKNHRYYEMMDIATKFYENNLKTQYGKEAVEYLTKRGIDKEIIKEFNIGLALKEKNILYELLKSKKYNEKEMEEIALINISDNIYDNFMNRIMFPLQDPQGNIIGFSGRIYYETQNAPKYINTRETVIFKKGQMLFNYHRAKPFIRNEKQVVVVEGYMDAIRLFASGIKNVVAIMGTSLTKEQIFLLKKLNSKIILCLDNDEPGQNAIYKLGKDLQEHNLDVEVIKLSGAKDPDEYILKNGVEAFQRNLNEPLKYLDFTLNYLKQNKNLNESVDLANYINAVLKDLAKEKDEILVDISLKKLVTDYNLDYDVLKSKFDELASTKKEENFIKKTEIKKEKPKINKYESTCKKILFYMMNDEKYVRIFKNNLIYLDNLNYREIAKEIIYYYETNREINVADFLSFASSNERFYPIVIDIVSESEEEFDEQTFRDYISSINKANKKNTIKELKQSLKEELDKNKKIEIAMKIAELKKGSV